MKHNRVTAIATLVLLGACGGDSTNPLINGGTTSGSASFTYTGGGGGSYNASGTITSASLAATPFITARAIGWKDATQSSTNIASNVPKSGGVSDLLAITIKGQSTGTATIDPNCVESNTSACTDVIFIIGQSNGGMAFSNLCTLTSGSVTVSNLSGTNATGTFSGSGTCITSSGLASAFVMANGAFTVPIVQNVPNTIP